MPNIAATLSLNVPAITALCKGEPGNTVRNGVGTPSASLGVNGDFYIDTSIYAIYGPKSGGVWGSGFILTNSTAAPLWTSTYTTMTANSASWSSVYSFVNSNSSRYQTTVSTLSSLSSRWQSNYTTTNNFSAGWWTTWNTVSSLSSTWGGATAGVTQIVAGTNVTISPPGGTGVVTINAAGGGGGGGSGADTAVRDLTARFQSTTSTVSSTSGNWNTSYNQVLSLSSQWNWGYQNSLTGTDNWNSAYNNVFTILPEIPNWNSTHDTLYAVSGGFVSTTSTVNAGSADWWNTAQTVLDPTTGLSFSASVYYNSTYVQYLSDTQVVQDPALGGPGTISRQALYDAIAVLFTSNYPFWNATTQALIFEPVGKPIVELGVDVLSADSVNTYILPVTAHRRTIVGNSSVRSVIRIPANDASGLPYGIGTEATVLQLGTGIIEISATGGQTINSNPRTNRYTRGGVTLWSTSGPYTMYRVIKFNSTNWVVMSSEI
jgi:hypothetical protein